MRRLTALLLAAPLAGGLACASASPLPGGPPDAEPPRVLGFSPDSGTVNFRGRSVTVQFDETVSDRGTGASALEALIVISPRDGEPRVAWSRSRVAVRPRDGFAPNTAYTITVAPGIADLRGNRTTAAYTTVLSTGATIPGGSVTGVAFDWPGQAFARTAWIEALRLPDSTTFVAVADSSGAFTVGPLGAGTYLVRGYVDQNRNRVLDRTEAWDSVRVTVATAPVAGLELLIAPRDTLPPRLQNVTALDSTAIAIEFDKPLDPDQSFTAAQVRVVRADSVLVPVTALLTRAAYDSARVAARPDSLRAAPADTARPAPARPDTAAADTTARRARPSRPAPPRTFVARLGTPLQPGTDYRVTVTGFRSLTGRTAPVSRVFTTARREERNAQPDSARTAPRDSTRLVPPRRP